MSWTSETVRVHRVLERSVAEGPGARSVVWVQGCSIRCPGCFNPGTWSPALGRDMTVGALVDALLARGDEIEGVTLLGGEPFEQAPALAAVARAVRVRGMSVMTFSGYPYERLLAGEEPGWSDLLAATDLLVDGPFEAAHVDTSRPWIGSTNQRFRFLTDRYADLAGDLASLPDRIELRIRRDGAVEVNGLAPEDDLETLLEGLGRRRHKPA